MADLRIARLGEKTATLASLQRLRNAVACERTDDLARIQAWIAIRKLYEAFRSGDDMDLQPLWQDAIARTTAWHDGLR